MNPVTVVIPVYKSSLSDSERISLEQCCKILGKHPFSLVCPDGLPIDEYIAYFERYAVAYTCVRFDPVYFRNIEGYNRLLLSLDFYKAFEDFAYILIHQLDALVFKDELDYWCAKGYDYIGAPWFKTFWRFKPGKRLYAVGNGGFSLRKVPSCIRVLSHTGKFKPYRYCFSFYNSLLLKLKKMSKAQWRALKFENSVNFFTAINRKTEDRFWSLDTRQAYVDFTVAPIADGLRFAFECQPAYTHLYIYIQVYHSAVMLGIDTSRNSGKKSSPAITGHFQIQPKHKTDRKYRAFENVRNRGYIPYRSVRFHTTAYAGVLASNLKSLK